MNNLDIIYFRNFNIKTGSLFPIVVRVTTASPIGQRIAIINIIPLEFYGLHYDISDMINCLPAKT